MADRAQLGPANRLPLLGCLYLRQHANDPVHWQPWDNQAFERAGIEDKPILLSIGYASCHWCHVMARESFADPATAALMNALFVCIKVDREERPDLDRFYLSAMAEMGKPVGWPLTVFLKPDATAFTGGGYFPPEPRFGLPAFTEVLREAAATYRSGPARPAQPTRRPAVARDGVVSDILLDRISRALAEGVDGLYGGFGTDGPKFLQAAGHELLLRAWDRTGDQTYLETAANSVTQMSGGAVFDHVGGGYHRYAVDDRWHIPHFEKMLNDNAQMIRLGTHLWQATAGTLFAARVEATIGWLLREMRLTGGVFASSLGADSGSGDQAAEGAYYLWTQPELDAALGSRRDAFLAAFEVVTEQRLAGGYALTRRPAGVGWTEDALLAPALETLRMVRTRRPPPQRDEKCLADWNGLAIAAMAEAGIAFDRPDWIAEAQAVFASVLDHVAIGPSLAHCAAGGAHTAEGLLDDYAAMAQAALALHEATACSAYLDRALAWEAVLHGQFWDDQVGGYFLTAAGAEQRIPRQKLIDETASPAGNGLMLGVLARLYAATGRECFRHRFEAILRCFGDRMSRAGLHAATALCHSQALERTVRIAVVGDGDVLRRTAAHAFLPDRWLVASPGAAPAPHRHAAYVCLGTSCFQPAFDAETLTGHLSRAARNP